MKRIIMILALVLYQLNISAQSLTISNVSSTECGGATRNYSTDDRDSIQKNGDWDSTISETYTWTIEDGTCQSGCNNDAVFIKWDNVCGDGKIKATFTRVYKDTAGQTKTQKETSAESIIQLVQSPSTVTSITTTNGLQVECNNRSTVSYQANGCATNYSWQVPSGWTIISASGKFLQAKPDNTSAGKVIVTASTPVCGSSLKSIDIDVLRKCPDNRTLNTTGLITAGVHVAVNKHIIVDNSASPNNYIKLKSPDKAWFKAGKSISIKSNFHAEYGSFFQAKIGPCNSCLAFKKRSNYSHLQENLVEEAKYHIKIFPNPTTGVFDIKLPSHFWSEVEVADVNYAVYSNIGQVISSGVISNQTYNQQIDLSMYASGLYIIELVYGEERYVSKIMKE